MPKRPKRISHKPRQTKRGHINRFSLVLSGLLLIIFLAATSYTLLHRDTYCTTRHATESQSPERVISAEDYFAKGNYDYDTGRCDDAVYAYSVALKLNPNYVQAYNNRAYTYMRLRQYDKALSDLNSALAIRPAYVNALLNRGDLFNYYGPILDPVRAIADYDAAYAVTGAGNSVVCGHRAVAITKLPGHGGWNILSYIRIVTTSYERICTIPSR